MRTHAEVPADVGIDLDALVDWMDAQGLGMGPLDGVRALTGGTQNILLRFERSGVGYVLRHPPRSKRANSDETMRREARVLAALADSSVPHPRLVAACPDLSVLGSAFYLMEPVDGCNVFDTGLPPALRSAEAQHDLAMAVVDALADLAGVDAVGLGLADLGRGSDWHARQVGRWRKQLNSYQSFDGYVGPELPEHDAIAAWLEAHRPAKGRLGLIHGDFHFANLLVAPDAPKVMAVIDWELATIGDPMLDLGHLLATWPTIGDAALVVDGADQMPDVEVVIARYAERTGFAMTDLVWFRVLGAYRLAVLLEGTHARAGAGMAPVEVGDRLHRKAMALCRLATEIIQADGT